MSTLADRSRPMRVVVALGGNALLRRGDEPTALTQRARAHQAAAGLASIAAEHELIVTHGNGPQIGMLAAQDDPFGLDALGAQSAGLIGYWLEQELTNVLGGRDVVTLLTRTLVARDDPALEAPSKPIGRVYSPEEGAQIAQQHGWTMVAERGGLRRVVGSPEPRGIVELRAIGLLVDAGVLVVCAGGGGVPIAVDAEGALGGVEAVVDKDFTSALLAEGLGADVLMLLTDVPGVMRDFGTPQAEVVREARLDELAQLDLPPGSMRPKVEACARFAAAGGLSVIASLEQAAGALAGRSGTRVLPAAGPAPRAG